MMMLRPFKCRTSKDGGGGKRGALACLCSRAQDANVALLLARLQAFARAMASAQAHAEAEQSRAAAEACIAFLYMYICNIYRYM